MTESKGGRKKGVPKAAAAKTRAVPTPARASSVTGTAPEPSPQKSPNPNPPKRVKGKQPDPDPNKKVLDELREACYHGSPHALLMMSCCVPLVLCTHYQPSMLFVLSPG